MFTRWVSLGTSAQGGCLRPKSDRAAEERCRGAGAWAWPQGGPSGSRDLGWGTTQWRLNSHVMDMVSGV